MEREEETIDFWRPYPHDDLALRCAVLHAQRRELAEAQAAIEVNAARRTLASIFVKGHGIEVGAGSRPFPIPEGAHCFYGDVRDKDQLARFFGTSDVALSGQIDAQTMAEIPSASLDFVISAHVIEHLYDPLGAIEAAIDRLKPGGVFLLVAPELTQTWDRRRPSTSLEHVIADREDGGEGTRLQAYIEHLRYVYPELTGKEAAEEEIEPWARELMDSGMDLHVHAWREADFRAMLDYAAPLAGFEIVAAVSHVNENAYVLRRRGLG